MFFDWTLQICIFFTRTFNDYYIFYLWFTEVITKNLVTMCLCVFQRFQSATWKKKRNRIGGSNLLIYSRVSTANCCRLLLSTVIPEFSGDHKNSNIKLGSSHSLPYVLYIMYMKSIRLTNADSGIVEYITGTLTQVNSNTPRDETNAITPLLEIIFIKMSDER